MSKKKKNACLKIILWGEYEVQHDTYFFYGNITAWSTLVPICSVHE